MNDSFAKTLRKLRTEKGLSQKQLGKLMYVNHSTVARWENGSRLPDNAMIIRLADCLEVDPIILLQSAVQSEAAPNVIMVEDSKVILADSLTVLEKVMPNAEISGFISPYEAIEYAKLNPVSLAILDIELGTSSGFDLCHALLEINPHTNVVFLTAYADYSLDAWKTEASGFMLKPLTPEDVKVQLQKLRHPFLAGAPEE